MNLKDYFSIYKTRKPSMMMGTTNDTTPSKPNSFFQWIALLIGVLIQPFFSFYKEHGSIIWNEAYKNKEFMIFAVIVAVIVFPSIYRKAFDSDRPKWIQMIPIFTAGLGWQTLVDSAVTGMGKGANEAQAYIDFIGETLALLI